MRVSHLGHSTVLIEVDSLRVLIDPGNYSTSWRDLSDLDAILVTHAHPDHIDPEWVGPLVEANPQAKILVEPGVPDTVDIASAVRFSAGESYRLGNVTIEAVGGRHATIHKDIPRIGNVGMVVSAPGEPRFFHPGDAVDTVPSGIDVLAVPAHGPWCAMKEIIDFTRSVGAPSGFLIHEGLINERGWTLAFSRLSEMTETSFTDLRGGTDKSFEVVSPGDAPPSDDALG